MINVYINYPMSKISIHHETDCPRIKQAHKKRQRVIEVNDQNKTSVRNRFSNNEHRFASNKEFNDMWLAIDLANDTEELSYLRGVKSELSKHYKPFHDCEIVEHC